jgi:hypothetical protein
MLFKAVFDVSSELCNLGCSFPAVASIAVKDCHNRAGAQVVGDFGLRYSMRLNLCGIRRFFQCHCSSQRRRAALGAPHVAIANGAIDVKHTSREPDLVERCFLAAAILPGVYYAAAL